MTAQLTGLNQQVIFPHTFVEIEFPTGTLRLFDGVGAETLNGQLFYSSSDWGSLATDGGFSRSVGAIETGFRRAFVAGPLLLQAARDPASSGSPFRVWTTNLDPDDGPTSTVLDHAGLVNLFTINHGLPTIVEIEVVNAADYLSDGNEELTMTDAGQRLMDPTDAFLEFVNTVDRSLPWGGKDNPRPVLSGVAATPTSVVDTGVAAGAAAKALSKFR